MNIADPVIDFLRRHGVDVVSAREQGWGNFIDSEILARARISSRFVITHDSRLTTHDSDFGTLAVHRGEQITGILYLRPGGRPPAAVISDLVALMNLEIDWAPPLIAVYRAGRLRLRRMDRARRC